MKKFLVLMGAVFLTMPMYGASEFVVPKKNKKELSARVKEEIVELLEALSRQIGKNITQSVVVQNQILDKIKEMFGDCQHDQGATVLFSGSTAKLKECRDKLKKYLEMLERQQADLQNFLLSF